jgi:hypothetical protein
MGNSVLGYQFVQFQGVLDREAVSIVIKIDVYGLAFFSPISDFFRPLLQFLIRIIRAIERFAPVKAEIDKVGSYFMYKREA